MTRRLAFVALTLAVLASACGSTAPTPTPPPSPEVPTLTAWERALGDVDENGTYGMEAALSLFATAFGPLPGVDVPQDLTGIDDRTLAILAVEHHRDELTDAQRDAIDAYLVPPDDAVRIEIPPVSAMATARLAVAVTPAMATYVRDTAIDYRRQIAQRIGFDIDGDIQLSFSGTTNAKDPWGEAWGYDGINGEPCQIQLYSNVVEGQPVDLRATIVHELFHCFQFHGYTSWEAASGMPSWIIEGQPTWVEASMTRAPVDGWWYKYLAEGTTPLTTRAYDALGFYAHLAETGIDPWSTFLATWQAGRNSVDAFRAAGADNPRFLQSWPSGLMREADRGDAWDTTGPSITAHRYRAGEATIANGTNLGLSAPFFTNDVLALSLASDLVHIEFEGDARLNDGALDTTDLQDAWFCVNGHDCSKRCPEQEDPPATQGTILSYALLALTGGVLGGVGHVTGLDLEECESPTPPPSDQPDDDPCATGCGEALGDVHLVTVGHQAYDFQGVGEFVMLRSTDGTYEVQARLQPYGNSRTVSVVTAVSTRIGDRRVAAYADTAHGTYRVAIDGQDIVLGETVDLGGGNRLVPEKDGFHVDMADGGYLLVVDLFQYGLNLIARPPDGRLSGIGGLMAAEAPGSDLPALADGTAIPVSLTTQQYYTDLYQTFATSWRIAQTDSLFDYEPGTSTETFTDRAFPRPDDVRTLDDLTAAQRAAGEAACREITERVRHDMCVYDVGITADAGFGAGYVKTAQLIAGGNLPASGDLVRVVNLYSNTDGPVALDVYAWVKPNDASGDGQATLVATVPYGAVGEFFDPGTLTGSTGDPANRVSIQRSGEPLNEYQFNLVDLERPTMPGTVRNMVVRDGDASDFSIVGGRPAVMDELYEASSKFYIGLQEAPVGKGLLFANIDPLYYDRPDSELYLAAGSGCLTYPDFPTVPIKLRGVPGATPLVVEPGDRQVSIHDAATGPDPAPGCTTTSAVPPIPLAVEAGGRYHLFVYVTPGDPTLRTLLVPFRG